jgi:hypothetical protein
VNKKKKDEMKTETDIQSTDDFQAMIGLLAVYTEAVNRLATLQTDANDEMMEWLDEAKVEYANYQKAATEAEAALEVIALKHQDWFTSKKSIKTPYGVVRFHSSTELEVQNPEATLVKLRLEEEQSRYHVDEMIDGHNAVIGTAHSYGEPTFKAADFIRTREELNLEKLEALPDEQLARLGIKRVHKQNFSVKPASLDLGKAVKEAVATESANAGQEAA